MKRSFSVAVVLALSLFAGIVQAEDKKADPTGTWKWSVTRNNTTRETVLKLKLEGDKLTGHVVGRDNKEIAIEDAKFKEGEVTFAITRENNGQKNTVKYNGKLDGDVIKGKSERTRDGKTNSTDWEAKRDKEEKK
jgi:hypothetical protein